MLRSWRRASATTVEPTRRRVGPSRHNSVAFRAGEAVRSGGRRPRILKERDITQENEFDLADDIAAALDQLLRKGFIPPIFYALVGINGAMLFGVYYAGGAETFKSEILARFQPPGPGGLAMPINIMYTDQRGEAARVVLQGPGKPPNWVN